MNEPQLLTDAEKTLIDVRKNIAAMGADEAKIMQQVTGSIKTHMAALIGGICFVVGALMGHYLK